MKDRKEQISAIVEFIVLNYNYGDTITYKKIEELTGYEQDEFGYAYTMVAVKNELIEYGCVLSAVIGEGYRILFPNEIAKEVYKKYANSSVKKLEKALKIMSCIDRKQLTEEEKEQFELIERIVADMHRQCEDNILKAQFALGISVKKELGK